MTKSIFLFLLIAFSQSDAFGFDYQRVEKAKYTVTYLGLPVVRVTMENGPPSVPDSGAYRISIQARTTKFWGLFYSIDNSYRTYLDSTGLPLVYSRNINEKSLQPYLRRSVAGPRSVGSGRLYAGCLSAERLAEGSRGTACCRRSSPGPISHCGRGNRQRRHCARRCS